MEEFLRNPLFAQMESEKLNFILDFASKEKPKNLKDAMPFLIASMNMAKKKNIQFSHSEIRLIAESLSKDLPSAEKEKIHRILSMMLN